MFRQHDEAGLCGFDGREHRADSAVIVQRKIDAEKDDDQEDHHVLGDRRPGRATHARHHHIGGGDGGADPHRRPSPDRPIAGGFHDDAEPFELQHQIRNERDDADQRDQRAEPAAFIFAGEKIGLRIEPVIARIAPDRRQHEIRHHIGERGVAEDVIHRPAAPVSKAAAAQECEGRVDLARHKQKDERRAERAAGDGPLPEPHLPPAPRQKTEPKRQ
jgi:hypothetical protein